MVWRGFVAVSVGAGLVTDISSVVGAAGGWSEGAAWYQGWGRPQVARTRVVVVLVAAGGWRGYATWYQGWGRPQIARSRDICWRTGG